MGRPLVYLFLLFTFSSQGQIFRAGIETGIPFYKYQFENTKATDISERRFSSTPPLGLRVQVDFSKKFSLAVSLVNHRYLHTFIFYRPDGSVFTRYLGPRSLQIPVMAKLNIPITKPLSFSVTGGGSVNFLQSAPLNTVSYDMMDSVAGTYITIYNSGPIFMYHAGAGLDFTYDSFSIFSGLVFANATEPFFQTNAFRYKQGHMIDSYSSSFHAQSLMISLIVTYKIFSTDQDRKKE